MAEKSWLYNDKGGDRTYNAEDIGAFLAPFFSGGIFANPSSNLQVTADGSGMTVTVQPGYALIKTADGKLHMYRNDAALPLPIATADGVNNRVDRIVVRHDTNGRITLAQIKQGAYATSPTAPTVEQDADYWELALADVSVPAGTTSISQAVVTDQRLNTAVCGVVAATVQQLDTSDFYDQIQSALSTFQSQYIAAFNSWSTAQQAAFTAWLQTVQNALSGDVAGNLLNLINGLAGSGRTTETVKGNADAITAHKADETLHTPYAVATNSGNAYSVTISPEPTAYADGLALCVKINAASTGAATLNVNGLGAVPVYDALGNAVTNFKTNTPYSFRYESSAGRFIVLGKGGGGTAQPADVASGKTFTNDGGTQTGTSTKVYGPGDFLLPNKITQNPRKYAYTYGNVLRSQILEDALGNIYFMDNQNHVVKLNSSGVLQWTFSIITSYYSLAMDSNYLYCFSSGLDKIYQLSLSSGAINYTWINMPDAVYSMWTQNGYLWFTNGSWMWCYSTSTYSLVFNVSAGNINVNSFFFADSNNNVYTGASTTSQYIKVTISGTVTYPLMPAAYAYISDSSYYLWDYAYDKVNNYLYFYGSYNSTKCIVKIDMSSMTFSKFSTLSTTVQEATVKVDGQQNVWVCEIDQAVGGNYYPQISKYGKDGSLLYQFLGHYMGISSTLPELTFSPSAIDQDYLYMVDDVTTIQNLLKMYAGIQLS